MNDVKVSVIVAVFNRETTLDRCIDSLVYQTLDDVEIILVDDSSEDNSMEVMKRWESLFPDKIRVFSNPTKGVAYTKNLGITQARGQYIAFVDSDDYVDYSTYQRLYTCAEENDFPDIVTSPIWKVAGGRKWQTSKLEGAPIRKNYLAMDTFFLPGKLFARHLFDKFGLLPHLGIGEDASWLFPVMSHTDTFAYIDFPTYFYELSPNSVSANYGTIELINDIFKGSERIIRETDRAHRERAKVYAWKRIDTLLSRHIYFHDVFEEYITGRLLQIASVKDMSRIFPNIYAAIAEKEKEDPVIPRTIFCNTEEDIEANEQYEKVFYGEINIVPLKGQPLPEDCPALVRQAAEEGNEAFVTQYMAARKCYEQGGIYIAPELEIDNTFMALVHDPAFFGHETDEQFTDKVFGCVAGNETFGEILKTYELPDLYDDPYAPLKARIRTILIGKTNRTFRNERYAGDAYGFRTYPVDSFVCTLPYAENEHFTHYRREAVDEESVLMVSCDTLKALSDRRVRLEVGKALKNAAPAAAAAPGKATGASLTELNRVKKECEALRRERDMLMRERDAIYNTLSWRITKPLRAVYTLVAKLKKR